MSFKGSLNFVNHFIEVKSKMSRKGNTATTFMRNRQTAAKGLIEASENTAKRSSRYPFIAEHRGGPLTQKNHHKLMRWARECSEHVLPLINENSDKWLIYALQVAKEWENSNVATGEAIKASLAAHAFARESSNPTSISVARSIGHAVATAHMADHSMGAALYALQAVKNAGKSIEEEREWQIKKLQLLPLEIVEQVLTAMRKKERHFRI